jgi:hypothetical protein
MLTRQGTAPPYTTLRPVKGLTARFPVYDDLVEQLRAIPRGSYHEVAAHVCAVAAGWAYSDEDTLSTIVARLGLASNRWRQMSVYNDAMFIASTAFLLQSTCGRVAVLCYRGTEPRNFINWLTDADVNPVQLPFAIGSLPDETVRVHGGFYRNLRATWHTVLAALDSAVAGRSILDDGEATGELEALYVTGHSLGAAMAALAGVRLVTDPAYRDRFGAVLRGVYTFGQPIVGDEAFASACNADEFLGTAVFRHVYGHDIVPRLPPAVTDHFVHFGAQLHAAPGKRWTRSEPALTQVPEILWSTLLVPAIAFFSQQLKRTRDLDLPYSWYDHSPTFYIEASTPPDVSSEFER